MKPPLVRRRRPARAPSDPLAALRQVALHEAGHAVMALAMGQRIRSVRVEASGHGEVLLEPGRGRRDPVVDALIAWAGAVAEGREGIQRDDAGHMRRAGLRPASVELMGEVARVAFAAGHLHVAVAAVAALLVEHVGERVPGERVREVAVGAGPWLARARW